MAANMLKDDMEVKYFYTLEHHFVYRIYRIRTRKPTFVKILESDRQAPYDDPH